MTGHGAVDVEFARETVAQIENILGPVRVAEWTGLGRKRHRFRPFAPSEAANRPAGKGKPRLVRSTDDAGRGKDLEEVLGAFLLSLRPSLI